MYEQSFFLDAAQAHSTRVVRSQRFPRGIFAGLALPPVQLFPGQTPAHELRCASVGNCAMQGPISARMLAAPSCLMPGTVCSSSNA